MTASTMAGQEGDFRIGLIAAFRSTAINVCLAQSQSYKTRIAVGQPFRRRRDACYSKSPVHSCSC
ncbi:MAG: hypothetical protein ACRBB0_02760 [Pelagimonas sp.]|uniref:hypothetical protein n=1 Tax=Pelagimonas sp. TaxID=2073170 RepID=UPI003D6B84F0